MKGLVRKLRTAIAFYTVLPLVGRDEELDFRGIALFAPGVGAGLGLILGGVGGALAMVYPQGNLWAGLVVVLLDMALTGGLHLDGAMDTADGLAVTDGERRLAVMADSRTGAFGAMALVAVVACKWVAMAELLRSDGLLLILGSVWAWARWGQLRAICAFDYLRAEGKGKFHREGVCSYQVWTIACLLAMAIGGIGYGYYYAYYGWRWGWVVVIPFGVSLGLGEWFNHRLGGHTGDTYGAIVEWTEAISLMVLVGCL